MIKNITIEEIEKSFRFSQLKQYQLTDSEMTCLEILYSHALANKDPDLDPKLDDAFIALISEESCPVFFNMHIKALGRILKRLKNKSLLEFDILDNGFAADIENYVKQRCKIDDEISRQWKNFVSENADYLQFQSNFIATDKNHKCPPPDLSPEFIENEWTWYDDENEEVK